MNISSLGENDTFDVECNLGAYIVFCTPFGASFIDVVGLIVVDGAYRVASTATVPSAAYIVDFIDAWARLSKFISDKKACVPVLGLAFIEIMRELDRAVFL